MSETILLKLRIYIVQATGEIAESGNEYFRNMAIF